MRIACPACTTEYEVPDRLLGGPARSLRCSRCAAEFPLPQVEAAPVAEPVPPPPAPEPAPLPVEPHPPFAAPPVPERAPTAAEGEPDRALVRAWTASLAIVAGGAVALVVFREAIMAAWPPATRFFAMLGLA
ncbi:zinc-ribbon domain-containing protein [Neoroseomonas soli]|uniref:Zinc finger/thioredoxin putative domain-containing protein n=1 Tax=Neoroseomonas soli TaxID=1081025 RepID=A0A9X9WZP5_9PROT|nr:zinc-ribbon domain-containing protein [Neoroseomonas soli]MBR0672624.1 hypothetical protein [Neoroseomonas soli]